MNAREATQQYRLAQWAEVMRARRGSGQTLQAFCDGAGITVRKYYYWQRKLREAAGREMPAAANKETLSAPNMAPEAKTGAITTWAAVELAKTASEGLTVEVGGCRITAAENTDMELLAKVVRALKAL